MLDEYLKPEEKYRPYKVKDILTKAKGVLKSKGWVQGTMSEGTSKFCARGAMAVAAGAQFRTWVAEVFDYEKAEYVAEIRMTLDDDPLIYDEAQRNPDYVKAVELANKAAAGAYGKTCSLIGYNDLPGRTVDEVVAVFDKAIELLDAEVEAAKHIAA